MKSQLIFLSNFIRHPKETASIMPSSKFLREEIIKNINFENVRCIVEYGPGTGPITEEILKRSDKSTKIICFEKNKTFCNYLSNNLPDERLIIINDGAENIEQYLNELNIKEVDYVISGLPFSLIPETLKHEIIQQTKLKLRKNGKFIVYQNSNHIKKYLKKYFNRISLNFEVLNVPPNFIHVCEK